jgi:hypothetical protein
MGLPALSFFEDLGAIANLSELLKYVKGYELIGDCLPPGSQSKSVVSSGGKEREIKKICRGSKSEDPFGCREAH